MSTLLKNNSVVVANGTNSFRHAIRYFSASSRNNRQGNQNKATGPAVKRPRKNFWANSSLTTKLCVLLLGVVFMVYGNTLRNGYVFDDEMVIVKNTMVTQGIKAIPELLTTPHMRGFMVVPNDLYRPLSLVMFAIEYQFFGATPAVGHFFSVLTFGACVLVLFLFLMKLFNGQMTVTVFIAALLFAVHPIHTEVVANIKSRDELLCFFFAFSALNKYMEYMAHGRLKQFVFGTVLLFLAYLSKETVISFVALIPFIFFVHYNQSRTRLGWISAGVVIATSLFLLIRTIVLSQYNANQPVGVEAMDNALVLAPNFITRVTTLIGVLGTYLKLLFVPYPLICTYSYLSIPFAGLGSVWFWLSLLAYVSIIFGGIRRFMKDPKDPWALGIFYYLTTLFLFSNIPFLMGAEMAERFAFFASAGFCLLVALACQRWIIRSETFGLATFRNWKTLAILIPLLLGYSGLSIARNMEWESGYSLFSADVEKSPNDARLHHHVAIAIKKEVIPLETDPNNVRLWSNEVFWHLKRSVEIYPGFELALVDLGRAYQERKMYDSAEYCFEKAMVLNPSDNALMNNLGNLYFESGNYDKALSYFRKTALLTNDVKHSSFNLALAFLKLKEYDSTIWYGRRALAIDSRLPDVHHAIAVAFYWKQNDDSAEYHYLQTVSMMPGNPNALNDLGIFYFYAKKYSQAIEQFRLTLTLDKNNATALDNLGNAYYLTGKYEAAIAAFSQELDLNPQNGHNIQNIALSYQKLGKKDLAAKYEIMARQFKPDFKLP